jgi:diguanylate cyclase (GGDEF)-like protein/PAS domain S-box-containing protein
MYQAAEDRGTMPPSFVFEFAALLALGPVAALLVSGLGALLKRRLANGASALAATAAAAYAHHACGGTVGAFAWPFQGAPIAAAVVVYALVKVVAMQVVRPLVTRTPVNRAWPKVLLRECPTYFVGAGIAVGAVELIAHRNWQVLPIAFVPVFFAFRAYASYLGRLEDEQRRLEVIDALDHGMAVIDRNGRVTVWSDELERLVGCARDRVLGRQLSSAVAALRDTALPRDISETLRDPRPRTSRVMLRSNGESRTLEVKLLPVAGGVTLLWHDVSERMQAEQVLKHDADRLALAARGAKDGLWEWDLRTQELYVSDRWKTMLGLPTSANISRIAEWFERVHPEDVAPMKDAIKAHVAGETDHLEHEHRIRHEDGTYRSFVCRGMAVGNGRLRLRVAGSVTDVTDQLVDRERLRTVGFRDPLTGLRNRTDFLEVLGRRLEEYKRRTTGERFAVLFLDLDRFKVINDSLGHLVGDELLIAVSRRLESCLRQHDCLGRLGGDEFAILLTTVNDESQANAIALRIQDALRAPLSVGGRDVYTSASIGIAFGHRDYTRPHEIMRDADTAMYHAKANGKARHELFDADMHARARDRHDLENDLRHAINTNDFEVHYQPIVSLASGMCVGFESLVRWTRNGKPVSPAEFIPIAEELGVIDELGTWVLQQACQTFADWQRRFPSAGLNCITVNASSRQLTQQNFPSLVHEAVTKSGLNPSDLRIEVTETALMDSPQIAAMVLSELRDYGVKIYLDDFGTGCSSLSHLHRLPVDALKIDRSFVMSLLLPDRPAIVESILALARTLRTSVVAEGIETEVQARELARLGCTHAQGYLFSRPLSMKAAEQVIIANEPLGPKRLSPADAASGNDAGERWSDLLVAAVPGARPRDARATSLS